MIECVTTTTVAQCVQSSGPGGVLLSVIVVVGRWLGSVAAMLDGSQIPVARVTLPVHVLNIITTKRNTPILYLPWPDTIIIPPKL